MHPSARSPRTLGAVLLATLSLAAGSALGSPNFPSVVKATVPMECTPDCTLCHQSTPGTGSPVTQPFALKTLGPLGLAPVDGDKLAKTIGLAMDADPPTDADEDGIPDFVELTGSMIPETSEQVTTNPNVADAADVPSADICPPEPKYGCGAAHVTPRPHVHTELVLFGLLAGVLGLGLWRRFGARRQS